MFVFKSKVWLITQPSQKYWVYEVSYEMPTWSEEEQEYVFKKEPKVITAQKAKELIHKNGLRRVYKSEDGEIYSDEEK